MPEVFLVSGVRTPHGRYGGQLASVRPDDLAGLVVGEVVRRAGVPPEVVDEVILGAANQAGEDNGMWREWPCCWPVCRTPFPASQ